MTTTGTKTFPIVGNYFKVVNPQGKDKNSIITSLELTYGCAPEKETSGNYSMEFKSNTDIHSEAGRGKWYYNTNAGSTISSSVVNGNSIDAVVNLKYQSSGTPGIHYRYEAIKNSVFSDSFTISFTISTEETIMIKRGSNDYEITPEDPQSYTANRTIAADGSGEDTSIFRVYAPTADLNNLHFTVTNILITRTFA